MYPIFVIAIGIAVLAFGKRLAVLGAAVGALLGLGLLQLFPVPVDPTLAFLVPAVLAALGFFFAGVAKGVVNIVVMVLGTLAGAAIMLGFLDLLGVDFGLVDWLLAVLGGIIGLVLVRRFEDWAMIILAGLVGALLVMRGLSILIPSLGGTLGTLLTVILAGLGIAYQGGMGKSK
jgi:hypothetical protein